MKKRRIQPGERRKKRGKRRQVDLRKGGGDMGYNQHLF